MSKNLFKVIWEKVSKKELQGMEDAIEVFRRELIWIPVLRDQVGHEEYDAILEQMVEEGYENKEFYKDEEYYKTIWEYNNIMRFIDLLINRVDDDAIMRFWADINSDEQEDAEEIYNKCFTRYQENPLVASNIRQEVYGTIARLRLGFEKSLVKKILRKLVAPMLTESDIEAIQAGVPMENVLI